MISPNRPSTPDGYENKFAELINLTKKATAGDVFMIAMPEALGDDYKEIVESLNRIADAEMHLCIVPRKDRDKPVPSKS